MRWLYPWICSKTDDQTSDGSACTPLGLFVSNEVQESGQVEKLSVTAV